MYKTGRDENLEEKLTKLASKSEEQGKEMWDFNRLYERFPNGILESNLLVFVTHTLSQMRSEREIRTLSKNRRSIPASFVWLRISV